MRRIGNQESIKLVRLSEDCPEKRPLLSISRTVEMIDERALSGISGMGFTALAAYYYFFIQHLSPAVFGVAVTCTTIAFMIALLNRVDVLDLHLSVRERLDVFFLTGVLLMLSAVIFFFSAANYGPQTGHAVLAFLLGGLSTYTLLSSRVMAHDNRIEIRPSAGAR